MTKARRGHTLRRMFRQAVGATWVVGLIALTVERMVADSAPTGLSR